MRRLRWTVAAVAMFTALMPLQPSAGSDDDDEPDRVALPDGWQPEGITTDGESLYVGSLANGAIWRADVKTGDGEVLAAGQDGRVGVGVEFDKRRDLLWVAGGGTSEIRAHDADSGGVLATYSFPTTSGEERFLNDLVVTRHGVYATDSLHQELAVVPLSHDADELPPASAAELLPLTGDLEFVEGFNANGIVESDRWLVTVQSNTGLLFRIDPRSGETTKIDLGDASLSNGDGLEIDDETLYVVRNRLNLVAVVELDDDLTAGEVVAEVTDPDFDVPTTVALARDSLWAVNARFGTTPEPDTEYWITRLDEFDD